MNLVTNIKTRKADIAKRRALHAKLMQKLDGLTNPKLISDMLNK
jgi:hypothetical protein